MEACGVCQFKSPNAALPVDEAFFSFISKMESRLQENGSDPGGIDATRKVSWGSGDIFATKNSLSHRTTIAGATGLMRSELMILTGLMIVRMYRDAYVKDEIFPVSSFSLLDHCS
jgi:hypothetical protein